MRGQVAAAHKLNRLVCFDRGKIVISRAQIGCVNLPCIGRVVAGKIIGTVLRAGIDGINMLQKIPPQGQISRRQTAGRIEIIAVRPAHSFLNRIFTQIAQPAGRHGNVIKPERVERDALKCRKIVFPQKSGTLMGDALCFCNEIAEVRPPLQIAAQRLPLRIVRKTATICKRKQRERVYGQGPVDDTRKNSMAGYILRGMPRLHGAVRHTGGQDDDLFKGFRKARNLIFDKFLPFCIRISFCQENKAISHCFPFFHCLFEFGLPFGICALSTAPVRDAALR